MRKRQPTPKPARPPNPGYLTGVIRRLAADRDPTFTDHALERIDERGLSIEEVHSVLKTGDVTGAITAGRRIGEWRCLVVGRVATSPREAGVVTVVVRGERLIVITAEWIDP
jgi:uncharacterized DUF497 family protein